MKVKVISRDAGDYERASKGDLHRVQTNVDPAQHPLEAAREYKRALNAVKLERVFAKPFVGQLSGHTDGIETLATHPGKLTTLVSGSSDGQVKIWSLNRRECVYSSTLHQGPVKGLCITPSGEHFISVGQDKTIKIARMDQVGEQADEDAEASEAPLSIIAKNFFTDVSHHRRQDMFATSGPVVELWSQLRSEPLRSIHWGVDTINCIKFNPVEVNVLATTSDDRHITLYDVRDATPLRKVVMEMRSNRLCWNPMEAFNFTVANEDHNLYTFDMRNLEQALCVHKDHVSAVMDVDYSPTGKEFVSASYDCTLRIFAFDGGHSREVYHTKRMQRLSAVKWSADNKYLMSASDEMSIRLWKSTAWEQLGTKAARQSAAEHYAEKLKEKFKYHPEIKRISRHRHVPKAILLSQRRKREMQDAVKRKDQNRRAHSKPGKYPYKAERKKHIVEEVE